MHINKYLLGISSVVLIGSIGWLSAGTLNISDSNFAKGFPIFKSIFFRSEGKDSINGSTNPEGVRLDSSGIYTAVPNGLPGGGGNVLKLNGGRQIYMDPVQNGNLVNDSISTIKIINNSIVNSNFADLAITNSQIQNNTIEITKFDPSIVWPTGGTMFITNNVCSGTNAIISVNNGTATCSLLPTGANSLPACSQGQRPVYTGGAWTCQTILLGGAGGDLYRTGSTGGWIANSNAGQVGVGTDTPTAMLNVSGSLEILGTTEDQVYCYATDTWVLMSSYNPSACAGCNAGFSYNPTSQLCEQNSCLGTGAINGACGTANGGTFSSSPTTDLCSAGNASSVIADSSSPPGEWFWSCNGINGGTNASCSARMTPTYPAINASVVVGGNDGRIIMVRSEGINISTINGSLPVSAGQNMDGGTTNGRVTLEVDTDGDPSGGLGQGSVRVTDSLGNVQCQNYAGASTYSFLNVRINNSLATTYVVLDSMNCGGGVGPSSNIYINNLAAFNATVNNIDRGGANFYIISNGTFPLTVGNQLDGIHGGLSANAMTYDINATTSRCIYTFINNPGAANNCNPGGFAQQTQGMAGNNNGTVWAPAFNDYDRVDILVCDGICN